jgi:DNA-binding MarR family transcriptional regulator
MPQRFVDDYLSYLLARASYVVYKAFLAEVHGAGLSSLEWRVLGTLADGDGDGVTIGELAAKVLCKQPTLTKLIDRMVEQGLVTKRDDAADRRRTLVFETARARKLSRPLIERALDLEREALRGVSERDVKMLKSVLGGIIARDEAAVAEAAQSAQTARRRRLAA